MSTTLVELHRDRWVPYFNVIDKQYVGWATTMEFLSMEYGDQTLIDRQPLQGISFETKGSATGDILVEVGDIGMAYDVHRINRPRVVRVIDTDPGPQIEIDIQIESEDGSNRLIHLRQFPALPPAGNP
jgi:hypothetical protein